MKHENNVLYYTINEVAKLVGVSSATIRNWERKGLIKVKRSKSNYRIFSDEDVSILKKIKYYSVEKKVCLNAIELFLPNDRTFLKNNIINNVSDSQNFISKKWKEIRIEQGYTLGEVSKGIGISVSHLSSIENGGNASLATLEKLAHFYHESTLYFAKKPTANKPLVKKNQGLSISYNASKGIRMQTLIATDNSVMYPILCAVDTGCGNFSLHAHRGEEILYILSGVIEFTLNSKKYILHPGDTFYYKGKEKHSWKNIASKEATFLWIHSDITKE